MKKLIALVLMVLAVRAYSESVNPASNVTADSANTPGTIVYRDSSGNFSAGAITITSIANAGQTALQVLTTAQLVTTVPIDTGAIVTVRFFTNGVLGSAYGTCISSGIAADQWVYPSTSTTSQARSCK